tara:strand:- start:1923 stop:2084 length:162 start_codon:yes stop_codon:yes gene_type:complete
MYRIYYYENISGLGFWNQYGSKNFKTEQSALNEVKKLREKGKLQNYNIKIIKD